MTTKVTLWILEDYAGCQFIYRDIFRDRFDVTFMEELGQLKDALKHSPWPHLLLADLKLKDGDFLGLISDQSTNTSLPPFLVVSSRDDVAARELCLKAGAVDFLVKPFEKKELLSKMEKVLYR